MELFLHSFLLRWILLLLLSFNYDLRNIQFIQIFLFTNHNDNADRVINSLRAHSVVPFPDFSFMEWVGNNWKNYEEMEIPTGNTHIWSLFILTSYANNSLVPTLTRIKIYPRRVGQVKDLYNKAHIVYVKNVNTPNAPSTLCGCFWMQFFWSVKRSAVVEEFTNF